MMKRSSIKPQNLQALKAKSILPLLTLFSGIAALIYESLWMRSFGLIFGNTTNAITLILATYMGGIALGSYLAGKVKIKNSLKTYVFIEAGIGITAMITYSLLDRLPGFWSNASILFQTTFLLQLFKILVTGAIVFLPTILLGATMPFLVKELSYYTNSNTALSHLYTMNTLGGAIGVVLSTYFLLPTFGMYITYLIAIALNFLIAIVCIISIIPAFKLFHSYFEKDKIGHFISAEDVKFNSKFWIAYFLTASIGTTSFGLEVLWTRSFVLVIGSSMYAFGIMLFTILLGLVAGSWAYTKFKDKIYSEYKLLRILLPVITIAIILSSIVIGWLPLFYLKIMTFVPLKFFIHQVVGFFLCFISSFLITVIFGFAFPMIFNFSKKMGKQNEPSFTSARLYMWNTFGAIVGAMVAGFLLIPFFGIEKSYVLIALLPIVSFLIIIFQRNEIPMLYKTLIISCIAMTFFFLIRIWFPWEPLYVTSGVYKTGLKYFSENGSVYDFTRMLKDGKKVLFYQESTECVVAAIENRKKHKFFKVNGKTDGGTGDITTQKLLSYVPLALHQNPKNAFIIGWGTGCTAGAAANFPLKGIDVVEIEPAVIKCESIFKEINNNVFHDTRVNIIINDARNTLLTSKNKYDVIISEPSNPWISGVSNLFTKDFYDIVIAHLQENGVFCQWFHVYDMPFESVKSQINTFCSVFPATSLWIVPPSNNEDEAGMSGDIFLIGSANNVDIDYSRIDSLFCTQKFKNDMALLGIENPVSFISNEILNRKEMLALSENGIINTDDNLYIESNAPKGLYDKNFNSRAIYDILQKYDNSLLPSGLAKYLERCVFKSNSLTTYYEVLGKEYYRKNFLSHSAEILNKAMEIDKNSETASILLGQISLFTGKFEEARKWYATSVIINSRNLESWNQLAVILYKLDQLQYAKEVNKKIMSLFPSKADGSFGMGMVYYKEGIYSESAKYLKASLKLDPHNTIALNTLRQIENGYK